MPHCPRIASAMRAESPRCWSRLVTPRIATFDSDAPARSVTVRSTRNTWLTCGNGSSVGAGITCRVRVSARPWPRSVVVWATGTSFHARTSRTANRPGVESDRGAVAAAHGPGRATVFGGQGRHHRSFHDAAELVEPVDVPGQLVVLDVASILRAENGDDVVVAGADQVVTDQRFALSPQVGTASGVVGFRWDTESDGAVE